MPKYVVRVAGVEFRVRIERENGTVSMTSGFFTTRFVEAAEPREAQSRAFLLIWKELTCLDAELDTCRLSVDAIGSASVRRVRSRFGFHPVLAQYWFLTSWP
jgi:hypothetical protein